jgi:hypothetical protein
MKEASYLIDYGDLLALFCLSFVFLWSGVSRASTMPTHFPALPHRNSSDRFTSVSGH